LPQSPTLPPAPSYIATNATAIGALITRTAFASMLYPRSSVANRHTGNPLHTATPLMSLCAPTAPVHGSVHSHPLGCPPRLYGLNCMFFQRTQTALSAASVANNTTIPSGIATASCAIWTRTEPNYDCMIATSERQLYGSYMLVL
jgi:hypothetical protein